MIHLFDIDVFYRDILVIFGDKETLRKDLYEYHKKDVVDEIVEEMNICNGLRGKTILSQEKGVFFVWFVKKPTTAQDIGFLVHELFHAVCAVMEMVGVEPSASSEEAYAYTLGFLTEQVFDKMNVISSCQDAALKPNPQECESPI